MQAHLYFICPTDHLETIIDRSFKQRNYYYTSLANSLKFDEKTINYLKALIKNRNIEEITLVLSENNPIFRDALANKGYSEVPDLRDLYREITVQKEYANKIWQKYNCPYIVLSYYLNKKVRDLRLQLSNLAHGQLKIKGIVYDKEKSVFNEIYSDLICREYFSLN